MPSTSTRPRPAAKPAAKKLAITPAVADVLCRSTIEGDLLMLPSEQLDRKLYVDVNKILTALGGKWNRHARGHVFSEGQEIGAELDQALGEGNVKKEVTGYFPTPPLLAAHVVEQAEIRPEHLVLEPSAGQGALADLLAPVVARERLYLVESLPANHAVLEGKGYRAPQLILGDFLSTQELPEHFDRIVMNPPFEVHQDVHHVRRAYDLLAAGGRLVAIMSNSTTSNQNAATTALRELLIERAALITANPDDAFKASGTVARTITVVVDKP
jgi:protein-L-isoaspartate O-methyltransferase